MAFVVICLQMMTLIISLYEVLKVHFNFIFTENEVVENPA